MPKSTSVHNKNVASFPPHPPIPPLASLRGASYQKRTMTPEPPTPTPRRKRRYLRWLGVFLLVCFAYGGWKAYDYRAAVKEAEALGWEMNVYSPLNDIKEDWHAAFRRTTWTKTRRNLWVTGAQGLTGRETLLLRLNPQHITIFFGESRIDTSMLKSLSDLRGLGIHGCSQMTDANMDQIQELSNLKELAIGRCPRLTHLNPLIGLKKLEVLFLLDNPKFPEKDIEAFKAAHPDTNVTHLP